MADVRLTATNPEDSSVVPVACNERGELLLEEPTLASDDYVAVTGDNMTGDLTLGTDRITLDASDGSAIFAGTVAVTNINPNRPDASFTNDGFVVGTRVFAGNALGQPVWTGREVDSDGIPLSETSRIEANGAALFRGGLMQGTEGTDNLSTANFSRDHYRVTMNAGTPVSGGKVTFIACYDTDESANPLISLNDNGGAYFAGDVVVSSRNKQWMLVESNGLCHMVEQTRAATADLIEHTADLVAPTVAEYPPLRDVFAELDAIEKALGEVMDKLRMAPPAGWEVWDGSSENS